MKNSKYIYDGVPLNIYCIEHGLNFRTQANRVKVYINKHPELTEQEAVDLAMSKCGIHPSTKYIYDNMSLADWCRENDENYATMISRASDIKSAHPNIDYNEAARIAIEEYVPFKYYYDDMLLVDYCRLHLEYNINSIWGYIKRTKKKYPYLSDQEVVDSYFEKEHKSHNSHIVDGVPLIEYCELHKLSYKSIIKTLSDRRKIDKYKNLTEQERLNGVIKEINERKEKEEKREELDKIIDYLKRNEDSDPDILKSIAEYLKIDYQNVINLNHKFSSISKTILFIWYFHNQQYNSLIGATEEYVDEIFALSKNLPTTKEEVMKVDLYVLIALYKAGIADTRYLILLHQDDFNHYALLEELKKHDIYLEDEEKEELVERANTLMLNLIDRNNINNVGMVISYITKSIKFYFLDCVPKYMRERDHLSIYSNDFKEGKFNLTYDMYDNDRNNMISEEVKDVVSTLDEKSRMFIYLKFYEQYSDGEISTVMGVDLEEVELLERNLLKQLSENEELKKLVRN